MSYGCHNKPRPVAGAPLAVQDGYVAGVFEYESGHTDRLARMVTVPFRMSTECKYDATGTDKGCAGCQHQAKEAP